MKILGLCKNGALQINTFRIKKETIITQKCMQAYIQRILQAKCSKQREKPNWTKLLYNLYKSRCIC